MMEIWIRSIARAGGVEMPAGARVVEARAETRKRWLKPLLATILRRLGHRRMNAGDRLWTETRPALRRS